ncbi:MAG TPA: class I SAM-dependent methyltransferase [Bacteroidales bacterium]|nr:class I SAM-dependent methyltransferase [Bacteroidales bacterium]
MTKILFLKNRLTSGSLMIYMENKEEKRLSTKEYWDSILEGARLPLSVNRKQYSAWLIDGFFREYILEGNYRTLLEAGAGSSAWLPYLAREYNLKVSGIDYSEPGCRICEENLKLQGIDYGEIICSDIFRWKDHKKYDIVISLGLIEHFENPGEVLKIAGEHLNPSGMIITVIPNLMGLNGKITRFFMPDVYNIHKKISASELRNLHEERGFRTLNCGYTGMFYPMIIPWQVKKDGFFFREGSRMRKITLKTLEMKNALITKMLRLMRIRPSSAFLSPFIIYCGIAAQES